MINITFKEIQIRFKKLPQMLLCDTLNILRYGFTATFNVSQYVMQDLHASRHKLSGLAEAWSQQPELCEATLAAKRKDDVVLGIVKAFR